MALEEGIKAPDFSLEDEAGKTVSLSGLKGKKVVLYFYPKDMTPGCTAQSCNLRDNYEALQSAGYEVLGISVNDAKDHQKFIDKYELPFSLLVDPDQKVAEAYDVWKEKKMYGKTFMGIKRTTYLIDEEGLIAEVIAKVDTKEHTSQILK